ncbi:serine protease inhibitor A3N-like isoform X2 [Meriones unguiculatus]|nr:serine protease inhibitor A3N-like isoform X2 [Meriones unguiculatus]
MAILVALGLLMAGFCPAVLCYPEGTLERDTITQSDQNIETQMDSLTFPNTDFAFTLYKEMVLKNPEDNIIFSPFSISSALAVLFLGANNNTQKEILEGLKFRATTIPEIDVHRGFENLIHMASRPESRVQVGIGSAVFIEKSLPIQAEFIGKLKALYQADFCTTELLETQEAKGIINACVREQTQEKTNKFISDLDERTIMVLVNYVYFKGKWKMPFDPHDTFESDFHLDKEGTVKVPMMKVEDLTVPYFRDKELSCSVVELEYTGSASALFILPDEGKMQQVEASLRPETLRKWKDSLRPRRIDEFYLPKFFLSKGYSLEDILPEMGIREVFSTQADLSGITGTKDLKVSQVVHKAVLDISETSTEASANTTVKYIFLSGKLQPKIVKIQKPILFFIMDTKYQIIHFMGKIINPMKS